MPEEASGALTALQKTVSAQSASTTRFNTELVRAAWSAVQRRRRDARRAAQTAARELGEYAEPTVEDPIEYAWIKQLWTDHIIVKLDNSGDQYLRIPFTVEAPGTSVDNVKFGKPEAVRMAYVAASAQRCASALANAVALARRVRTQAGSNRYRKPIGAQLGIGAPGGEPLATVAKTGSRVGAGVTADALRKSIKSVSQEQTYRGGKVFGDISDEGKLKRALSQIENLSDDKRGAAAAEVVKAAQSLGLTSLVPTAVKRLYRQYIAQSVIKSPSKASKARKT